MSSNRWVRLTCATSTTNTTRYHPFTRSSSVRLSTQGSHGTLSTLSRGMAEERIQPDMVVYGTLISAAQKAGEGQAADAWLQQALQDGIRLDKNCPLESMESFERQFLQLLNFSTVIVGPRKSCWSMAGQSDLTVMERRGEGGRARLQKSFEFRPSMQI